MPLVEVRGLRRTFFAVRRRPGVLGALRDLVAPEREIVTALDGLELAVEAGEAVGLLGPNGACKSTTVKCVAGLLAPTGGAVRVDGRDPFVERAAHVRGIGVVFGQRTQLWWDLPVDDALGLLAAVFDVSDADRARRMGDLDDLLGIGPLRARRVRDLSHGERMRCEIAAALIHAPRLLLLDEPTLGLDAAVRRDVRAFLRRLAVERGVGILLTSHDLGDVEAVCDRVVVIDGGRAAYDGGLAGLRSRSGLGRVVVVETDRPLGDEEVASMGTVIGAPVARRGPRGLEVRLGPGVAAGPALAALVARLEVVDASIEEPSTEAVVAALWGAS